MSDWGPPTAPRRPSESPEAQPAFHPASGPAGLLPRHPSASPPAPCPFHRPASDPAGLLSRCSSASPQDPCAFHRPASGLVGPLQRHPSASPAPQHASHRPASDLAGPVPCQTSGLRVAEDTQPVRRQSRWKKSGHAPSPLLRSSDLLGARPASTRQASRPLCFDLRNTLLPSCIKNLFRRAIRCAPSNPVQRYPNFLRYTALSVPTTKRSNRLAAQETASTGDTTRPPRDSQPPQLAPFHHRCHTAWS